MTCRVTRNIIWVFCALFFFEQSAYAAFVSLEKRRKAVRPGTVLVSLETETPNQLVPSKPLILPMAPAPVTLTPLHQYDIEEAPLPATPKTASAPTTPPIQN